MYKVHHDAAFLPLELKGPDYVFNGDTLQAVSASVSRDRDGIIHMSVVNIDPHQTVNLSAHLPGVKMTKVVATILKSSEMTSHNAFEHPDTVKPSEFKDFKVKDEKILAGLPPGSVIVFEIR